MKKLAVVVALLFLGVCVFSQDQSAANTGSFGVVIYAEGDIVSVIRDGRRFEYDAFTGELLGFPVYGGDIIQTDPDTYLEIQLLPSRSIVKVAENTSFTVQRVSSGGEGVFDLSYGRLRARVSRLTGRDPFEIRGIGVTAGVRGTDFGTDVIIGRDGGDAVTRVYCFEGEVEVIVGEQVPPADSEDDQDVDTETSAEPDADAGTEAPAEPSAEPAARRTIIVTANQMVTASRATPTAAAARGETAEADELPSPPPLVISEVEVVRADIQEYWEEENFVAEAREAEQIFSEFPSLREETERRLGTIPFLPQDQPAEPVETEPAKPEPEPEAQAPTTQDAVELEDEEEPMDPERQRRLIGATKAAGFTMLGLGLVADAAAVTFYFWGDQLVPDWEFANDPETLLSIGAAGGVFVIGGILSLVFSYALGN